MIPLRKGIFVANDREAGIIDMHDILIRNKGTISCCMIARNEEEFIASAIGSVKDLADEIIVVDTGSDDRTASVARACGAKVYHALWTDDFSAARNASLAGATKEWILILDADESIASDDHGRIRELIARYPDSAFLFEQRTYSNNSSIFGWKRIDEESDVNHGALGYFSNRQVRLFRNDGAIRYRGHVHENVEHDLRDNGISMSNVDIVVHHYGRLEASDRVSRKSMLYLSLGKDKLSHDPENTKYIYEIASQLLEIGHAEEAAEHIEKVLQTGLRSWEFNNLLGLAYMKLGRKDDAVVCLRAAVDIESNNPDLHNNLGVALMEDGKAGRALDSYREGLLIDGDNANLLRNAASACCSLGMISEADDYIRQSLAIDPFMPQSHAIQAEVLFRKGDFAGADSALKKIRFLPGTLLKVYLKSLHLYVQMGMIEESEMVLENAIRDYPENEGLLYLSGKIFELKGDDEKAMAALHGLIASGSPNSDVLNSLGCIYERRGEFGKALEYFSESHRLSPSNVQISVNLGIIKGKAGMNDEAESHLRQVIAEHESCGAAYNALGCILASTGRFGEAMEFLVKAVELEPGKSEYYLNVGLACEKLNLFSKAIEFYECMVRVDPKMAAAAKERLGRLLAPASS